MLSPVLRENNVLRKQYPVCIWGDILKATFPLEEFEGKFDAQKLTAIMNYPNIYKDVYVQVAQWIYGEVGTVGSCFTYRTYHAVEII